jgi:hypothetical protein
VPEIRMARTGVVEPSSRPADCSAQDRGRNGKRCRPRGAALGEGDETDQGSARQESTATGPSAAKQAWLGSGAAREARSSRQEVQGNIRLGHGRLLWKLRKKEVRSLQRVPAAVKDCGVWLSKPRHKSKRPPSGGLAYRTRSSGYRCRFKTDPLALVTGSRTLPNLQPVVSPRMPRIVQLVCDSCLTISKRFAVQIFGSSRECGGRSCPATRDAQQGCLHLSAG